MLLLLNYSLLVPLNNIDNIKYVLLLNIKRSKSSIKPIKNMLQRIK